jgi:methionyl-tRNA formyltransferase
MKVVLISQVPPAAHGLTELLRALGHDPVALLCSREHAGRYGGEFDRLVRDAPEGLDVVIPPDALSVPRLGAMNGHPSLLPWYRGPNPVAWMIRNGESEIGFTLHRMDDGLDTGPILAQASIPLGDEHSWEELESKFIEVIGELLTRALARLEEGDPGDLQEGEGSYYSFFEPEYVRIHWSRSSEEIARQVRAWRFASRRDAVEHGALAEIEGETVRVLRVSLEPTGGRPMETGDGTIWIVETEPA